MDQYLIFSHDQQAWRGPKRNGYTAYSERARLFTEEEAIAIVQRAAEEWLPKGEDIDLLPPEVMVCEDSASLISAVALASALMIQRRG